MFFHIIIFGLLLYHYIINWLYFLFFLMRHLRFRFPLFRIENKLTTSNAFFAVRVFTIKSGVITMMQTASLGSISPTFYEQLLRSKIPKAQKDSQIKQLFALLGSACIKAAREHVDEIEPRVFVCSPPSAMSGEWDTIFVSCIKPPSGFYKTMFNSFNYIYTLTTIQM